MADGLGPDAGRSTTGSNRFMTNLVSRLPYSYGVLDNARDKNPKFDAFSNVSSKREDRIQKLSLLQKDDDVYMGGNIIDKTYHQYMYADLDADKVRRIQDYRRMSAYAELSDAIDEICDECITKNKQGEIVEFLLKGKYDNSIRESLKEEWKTFINIFTLEDTGWAQFRRFLVEGELYYENLIHENHKEVGVVGIVPVPTELINPIYDTVQNQIIKGFLLRKPKLNPKRTAMAKETEDLIPLDKNQVTYIHSSIWNEDHTIRLPYIENARRAYRQLSLIEDSIVIYRLVRAPERLAFYIDVGNASPPKAEGILKRAMQSYTTKRSFANGKVTNIYDPQSMLDNYWFAKRSNNDGTKVETIPTGQNLGQLDDLLYFQKKLYKSLKVPQSRLDPTDPFKDGIETTREELRFARFIMRIQRQFAAGIKDTFMVHLKLRGLWDKLKLKEHELQIEFATPSNFQVVRDQQVWELMWNNFNQMSQNEMMSKTYGQRYFLKMDDAQIAENREWLKQDAALTWELDQIRTQGPNWRDQMAQMDDALADASAGGAGGASAPGRFNPLGGNADEEGPKAELPPEFGGAPTSGEGAEGAPAPSGPAGPAGSALPGQPPQ